MATTGLVGTTGCFVGRVWSPDEGPLVVALRDDALYDITSRAAPTMHDVLEQDDPAASVNAQTGRLLCSLHDQEAESMAARSDPHRRHFMAPNDLQAVKACGVTFVGSMLERMIEERAEGDTTRAQACAADRTDRQGCVQPARQEMP